MLYNQIMLTVLLAICLLCIIFICFGDNFRQEPKNKKILKLGQKFKVVTGPQFSELFLNEKQKTELQMLVENTDNEVHRFIAESNYFYFVIKHVLGKNPEPYIFCSKNPKAVITSEMTHNSSVTADFLEVPLAFEQLYSYLSKL